MLKFVRRILMEPDSVRVADGEFRLAGILTKARKTTKRMARLLIVDDTPEVLLMLAATLDDIHEVTTALSGPEVLQIARQAPPVDLILLDVAMPGMSGYEVCQALKQIPAWSRVPVIFVTAMSNPEDEERGLKAGAVDYISKPFHPDLVRARVSNHVELKRHRDDLEREVQRRSEELVQATLSRRLLERDLKLAHQLQMSLLPPDHYQRSGCQISTCLRPAQTIGGDFYDYVSLSPTRLLFALGDVSDKGVAAALFMVRVITLLHWLAPSATDPSQLMKELNLALCRDNDACMFVTLGLGLADLEAGEIHYASAGHEYPIRISPGEPAQIVEISGGPALGLIPEADFPLQRISLGRNQSLMLYSDGVPEANNSQSEEFGSQGLLAALSGDPASVPATAVDRCLQAVESFTAGAEPSDDITLLAFQWDTSSEHHWRVPNQLSCLREFQQNLHQALKRADCPDDSIHDLELATEELLANTIQYGYPAGVEAMIDVTVWADAGQVKVLLRDTGNEFDPLQAEERPDDKCGGWGIPLIQHLMDEFTYERVDEANLITLLRKRRDSEAS